MTITCLITTVHQGVPKDPESMIWVTRLITLAVTDSLYHQGQRKGSIRVHSHLDEHTNFLESINGDDAVESQKHCIYGGLQILYY